MHVFLALLSSLALVLGLGLLVRAKTSIHEIQAYMLLLISAVLLVGSAVRAELSRVLNAVARQGLSTAASTVDPSDDGYR